MNFFKHPLLTITLLTGLLLSLLAGCSSPVTYPVHFDNVSFDPVNRRTVVSAIDSTDQAKIEMLTNAIVELGPNVDRNEAHFVAREAVLFPKHLANEYDLMWPPNYQNVLINTGKRKRGLCFHWAQDMAKHLISGRHYNTLTLRRVVANQGTFVEHNVLAVSAKGKGIEDAYILDGWRESGTLYWVKTTEDPDYDWKIYKPQYANRVNTKPIAKEGIHQNVSVQ
jgi:hypothetical protein